MRYFIYAIIVLGALVMLIMYCSLIVGHIADEYEEQYLAKRNEGIKSQEEHEDE